MKKRILASLLCLCLLVGTLPTAALAADETQDGGDSVVCAELAGCVEDAHDEDCPLYVAPEEGEEPGGAVCTCEALCAEGAVDENCPVCAEDYTLCACEEAPVDEGEPALCTLTEGCTLEAGHEGECVLPDDGNTGENDNALDPVADLQDRINALPGADALADMDEEEQAEAYAEVCAIYDAIDELTEDEADALDVSALEDAAAFFTPQIMFLEEPDPVDGELDIASGAIVITETGYSQGTLKFIAKTGFVVTNAEGTTIAETLWPEGEAHALTITGESDTNNIVIAGGNPTITLNNLTISNVSLSAAPHAPAIVLLSAAGDDVNRATLTLVGSSSLRAAANAPAVQINHNAELTICGDGSLTATGSGSRPGIGSTESTNSAYGMDPSTKTVSNNYRGGGELVVEGGTIIAGSGSGCGLGNNNSSPAVQFGKITIKGGSVTADCGNNGFGIKVTNLVITGGLLHVTARNTAWTTRGVMCYTGFNMSGGTLTMYKYTGGSDWKTVSITGGNVNGCYTAELEGRTLTKLYFTTEDGSPAANTEVTVKEGEEEAWTALTNDEGIVTTYFSSGTTSVTAKAGTDGTEHTVSISDGLGVVGASCTCATDHGVLSMVTQPQSLTVAGGSAVLELEAAYAKGNCVLPEGFHGDYEKIGYEITKVIKNGQYVTAGQYASIEDHKLTVYGETNLDPYTVYVRAVSGPESNKIYSGEIAIAVGTYGPAEEAENTFDIGLGDVVIADAGENSGKTVYTQGEKIVAVDSGTPVTITGASNGGIITVKGGNPTIVLKDVTITAEKNNQPALLLYGGTGDGENYAASATVTLEGTNVLTGNGAPAVQININAKLTIQGDGSLETRVARAGNQPAIGAANNNTYAYAYTNSTTSSVHNNYRGEGNLVIKSGTISATGTGGGTSGKVAAIGQSYYSTFGSVTVEGGTVKLANNSNAPGLTAQKIEITGGVIEDGTTGARAGLYAGNSLAVSGGTVTGVGTVRTDEGVSVSITGGNVNTYYSGEVTGRILTRLYFVHTDGAPVANTEVTVTEGQGDDARSWTAYTSDAGVITTYFGAETQNIQVSYGSVSGQSVALKDGQALIGGECTCASYSGITWDAGLPAAVTLYGSGDSAYSLAAAKLVVDGDCPMPIHPNLTAITYSLSVTKDGSAVGSENVKDYAALENGTLTLKPGSAPYTVTLTASAGDKSAVQTLEVKKGESETVIDLSTEVDHTKTLENDTTAMVTGNAAEGKVAVTGGTAALTLNQDSADNVWSITAAEGAASVTLDAQTVNGKVRFGNAGEQQYVWGYISADKVKLNPDAGDITFDADGSVTQGKFTLKNLGEREIVVMGADTEAARSITNNSGASLTLTVNDVSVTLTADGSYEIPQAVAVYDNSPRSGGVSAENVWAYIVPNGSTVYFYDNASTLGITGGDDLLAYSTCEPAEYLELLGVSSSYLDRLTRQELEAYTLVFVGEGSTATPSSYPESRGRITAAVFDADLNDLSGNLFRGMQAIDALEVKYAESAGFMYSCGARTLTLGKQVERYGSAAYARRLQEIVVEEGNPYLMTHEGVLYTADGTTLLQCPSWKTGDYTLLSNCEKISNQAFYGSRLSTLTLNKGLKEIGNRCFEEARMTAYQVQAGNTCFQAIDGALYSADGKTLILYPRYNPATEYEIPEGTQVMMDMSIYRAYSLRKLTLPSTMVSVDGYFPNSAPLEELVVNGLTYDNWSSAPQLKKVTVVDGYDFTATKLFNNSAMSWVTSAGITVTGGNIPYDGAAHGVTVTAAEGCAVEYSTDGETYSATAPTYTAPGAYTVYWRITRAADDTYTFARELYSSRTFTISELETSEDWFILAAVKPGDAQEGWAPVTLSQPSAAPSLENGYTVKYSKDGAGNATETIPTEAGSYLVTVDIHADGYAQETLTLGWYTILSDAQGNNKVLSFVTNGGTTIKPIIAAENSNITKPDDPTRDGYTFAGWYTDAALRTAVETFPTTMPASNTTYYAKWTRNTYTITYNGIDDAEHDNPTRYTVESGDFSLTAPVKPGYTFTGWTWEGQAEPQREVTIARGSYGDKIYAANWDKITYTIIYPNSFDIVESNPTTYSVDNTSSTGISLTAPAEREGYTFSGWAMSVDGVVSILPVEGAAIPQGTLGSITLTGIWLAQDQTLTLNANGGKFADDSETMTITAEYASTLNLTEPVRNYYDFAGWYTDEACTTPFTSESMPLTSTIYAKWMATKYSITYQGMEEAGTVHNNPATYTFESDNITLTAPSRPGYTFTGWTWEGQTTPQTQVTISAGSYGNKTYTANWQVIPSGSGGGGGSSSSSTVSVDSGKNGSVTVSPSRASKNTTVTITVKPNSGYELDELTVTDKNGNEVKLTKKSDTQYTFTMPASKVTVEASFVEIKAAPDEGLPFVDVSSDAYYADAVAWAVENGITSGTSDTTFSPDAACTRAQMVMFLWRAAGSPKATSSNPFTDLQTDAYYYDAVLWAVEQGITSGTSATTFSPDVTVTRGQTVTFLYRANGSPAVSGSSFADVSADAYYANAVAWAVAEGITVGTGNNTFSPDADCTRGQIVTFMYRNMA